MNNYYRSVEQDKWIVELREACRKFLGLIPLVAFGRRNRTELDYTISCCILFVDSVPRFWVESSWTKEVMYTNTKIPSPPTRHHVPFFLTTGLTSASSFFITSYFFYLLPSSTILFVPFFFIRRIVLVLQVNMKLFQKQLLYISYKGKPIK